MSRTKELFMAEREAMVHQWSSDDDAYHYSVYINSIHNTNEHSKSTKQNPDGAQGS